MGIFKCINLDEWTQILLNDMRINGVKAVSKALAVVMCILGNTTTSRFLVADILNTLIDVRRCKLDLEQF